MSTPLPWADRPPPDYRPRRSDFPRVLSVPPQKLLLVRFLGRPIFVPYHWREGHRHSFPCLYPRCSLCPAEARDWVSYAPASVALGETWSDQPPAWCRVVLTVTVGAYRQLEATREDQWRGLAVIMTRRQRPPCAGEVKVEAAGAVWDGYDLPDPFDVVPVLCRMWSLPESFARPLLAPYREGPAVIPFPVVQPAAAPPQRAAQAVGEIATVQDEVERLVAARARLHAEAEAARQRLAALRQAEEGRA